MSRKQFILASGATCRNWGWSWSFVDKSKRVVIFGAWDRFNEGGRALILAEGWERGDNGRKKPAYSEAREHIRLIEEEAYELQTFPMLFSDEAQDRHGQGPARIGGFIPNLTTKRLIREGDCWYAI
jgi:5-methylcytosine-specific restriction protein A